MFTYTEELEEKSIQKIREYFPDTPTVLFDIETTGLSRRACHIYLIGAIAKTGDTWTLNQWFLDHPFEEKELLMTFAAFLEKVRQSAATKTLSTESFNRTTSDPKTARSDCRPVLITFNGQTFDLPYVREKCSFYQLPDPFDGFSHCDLYRELFPLKKTLHFSSMKQKDVEQFLGIKRKDEKTGGELISVYQTYLKNKDLKLYDLLMLHNHDDVTGLADLTDVLAWSRFLTGHSFTVADLSTDLIPAADSSLLGVDRGMDRCVLFTLKPTHPLPAVTEKTVTLASSSNASLTLEENGKTATLCVRTRKDCLKHFYPDYKNYFYLPEEDQAVHKDVAVYVPKDRRIKAKASTCYTKQAGEFLPQPSELIKPAFYTDYKTYPSWFLPTAEWLQDPEALHAYCASVINALLER